MAWQKQKEEAVASSLLSHKDSNLKRLNQNQLCYQDTMGHRVFTLQN